MANSLLQPITPTKSPRYRAIAYTAIKEAILVGWLEPEQPLIEEQLATSLNISRTPVRESLAILEHEGLIGPHGSRGLYVRKLTRNEFLEMFTANETIEPYLARRAARLATEAQLEQIKEAVERGQQSAAKMDIPGFLRAGRDFHRNIGLAADNAPLTKFVVGNEERTDLYLLSYRKNIDMAKMRASNREHAAIYKAIAQRDPEAAARLVIYHSQSLRERFSVLFSSQSEDDQTGL